MPDDATPLRELGWQQGSILPDELRNTLVKEGHLTPDVHAAQLLVVVSHDCDLLNLSFAKEPFVELLLATERDKDDGMLRYGKHPRRLLVDVHCHGVPKIFELSIHDRVRIERKHLLGHAPDQTRTLATDSVQLIVRWIVKRYFRAAFPGCIQ